MKTVSATGAYGRDYPNAALLLEHWHEGKDFALHALGGTTYFSIRDVPVLQADGYTHIQFRFNRSQEVAMLHLNPTHPSDDFITRQEQFADGIISRKEFMTFIIERCQQLHAPLEITQALFALHSRMPAGDFDCPGQRYCPLED